MRKAGWRGVLAAEKTVPGLKDVFGIQWSAANARWPILLLTNPLKLWE